MGIDDDGGGEFLWEGSTLTFFIILFLCSVIAAVLIGGNHNAGGMRVVAECVGTVFTEEERVGLDNCKAHPDMDEGDNVRVNMTPFGSKEVFQALFCLWM